MKKDLRGLAIDTAGFVGSISLMNDGEVVDYILLDEGISRAEDLVFRIRDLLIKNHWKTKELDFVSYCSGPGSFTGIRIGAATSLGISRSVGCVVCVGITKFEALAEASTTGETSKILIEGGSKNIFIAELPLFTKLEKVTFDKFKTKNIFDIKLSDFDNVSEVILQKSLYQDDFIEKLEIETKKKFTVASDNVSGLIGVIANRKIKENSDLENMPVYSSFYGS